MLLANLQVKLADYIEARKTLAFVSSGNKSEFIGDWDYYKQTLGQGLKDESTEEGKEPRSFDQLLNDYGLSKVVSQTLYVCSSLFGVHLPT